MQNYNLPQVNHGNTFEGVSFILPTDPAYNLTGASAKLQVRNNYNQTVVKEFSSTDGLAINPPYTIDLAAHLVTLEPGTYKWDLQITFGDGRVKTYIGGDWLINTVITE